MSVLDIIRAQGVPIHAVNAAAQYMGETGEGRQADDTYVQRIKDITGIDSYNEDNSNLLYLTYKYLVVGVISALATTDRLRDAGISGLLVTAAEKADNLLKAQPWLYAKAEGEEKLDDNGKVKPKKGAKKRQALELFPVMMKENDGKHPTRQAAIQRFVDELKMTPAGASTYVAMCKKEYPEKK